MTTTELLALFRSEVSDLELPYLWSDALVYGYIDEAQKQFCRQTVGIEDARSYKLTIVADTEWYALDPKILKLRSVIDRATGIDVPTVPVEKMTQYGVRFNGVTGPVKVLVTGLQKGYVRAYPLPNTAAVLELRTFRLPEDVAAGDDFEIDDQHVRNLLHWVKHKAYSMTDAETYDPKSAAANFAMWDSYCARALNEQSRLRHSAGTVVYGGL